VEGVALMEAIDKVMGRRKRPIGFAANASNNGVTWEPACMWSHRSRLNGAA